jgi:hypothetical protein
MPQSSKPGEVVSKEAVEALAERIAKFVKHKRRVSWMQLVDRFPEMGGGTWAIRRRAKHFSNVVVWGDLSRVGKDAYVHARDAGLIKLEPMGDVTELQLMGGGLKIPIATRVCHYRKPHWAPSWIVAGDRLPGRATT